MNEILKPEVFFKIKKSKIFFKSTSWRNNQDQIKREKFRAFWYWKTFVIFILFFTLFFVFKCLYWKHWTQLLYNVQF